MDDLYQLFGRITGRTKEWPTYCQTTVYCDPIIHEKIQIMEDQARNVSLSGAQFLSRNSYRTPSFNRFLREEEERRKAVRRQKAALARISRRQKQKEEEKE